MPPAPPGEQKLVSRKEKKKKSVLSNLFKKKKQKPSEPSIPLGEIEKKRRTCS